MLTKTCFHGLIAPFLKAAKQFPNLDRPGKQDNYIYILFYLIKNLYKSFSVSVPMISLMLSVKKPTLLKSITCEDRGINCNLIFIFEFLYFSQLLECELMLLTCAFDLD